MKVEMGSFGLRERNKEEKWEKIWQLPRGRSRARESDFKIHKLFD